MTSMHYDYVVETQNKINDHNRATSLYLEHTKSVRERLIDTRDKLNAEIATLESLMDTLQKVGEVGKQAAHVFQHAVDSDEDHDSDGDETPASKELERKLLEGLTFQDLDPSKTETSQNS